MGLTERNGPRFLLFPSFEPQAEYNCPSQSHRHSHFCSLLDSSHSVQDAGDGVPGVLSAAEKALVRKCVSVGRATAPQHNPDQLSPFLPLVPTGAMADVMSSKTPPGLGLSHSCRCLTTVALAPWIPDWLQATLGHKSFRHHACGGGF